MARGPVVIFTFQLDSLPDWQREYLAELVEIDQPLRSSQSVWALLPPGAEDRIVRRLAESLATGTWDAQHGHLRHRHQPDGALRLIVSEP